VRAQRIAAFGLTTPDARRLAEFYAKAFCCRCSATERLEGAAFEHCMGVDGGARRLRLTVGEEIIELLQFDQAGSPYPKASSPAERSFQHFALVVADMDRALERLAGIEGWSAISRGPQRLPDSAGGVTAYKFRDPDGHPLEFLEFPADRTPVRWQRRGESSGILGIDHSAISVADTETSVAFYRDLGFAPTAHSLNQGLEQAALDGIPLPHVEVTALTAHRPDPHVELLCYRSDAPRGSGAAAANDVAATRIVIVVDGPPSAEGSRPPTAPKAIGPASAETSMVLDPDGHRLHFVSDEWVRRFGA
jgi:catechol 2,3-dioxygenase-like lactoylglutathione lyase family enzyme